MACSVLSSICPCLGGKDISFSAQRDKCSLQLTSLINLKGMRLLRGKLKPVCKSWGKTSLNVNSALHLLCYQGPSIGTDEGLKASSLLPKRCGSDAGASNAIENMVLTEQRRNQRRSVGDGIDLLAENTNFKSGGTARIAIQGMELADKTVVWLVALVFEDVAERKRAIAPLSTSIAFKAIEQGASTKKLPSGAWRMHPSTIMGWF
jgi:hypothetical protein